MHVLIIGPAYPYRGGIADTNEALARALQRAGRRVTLVTFTLQYPDFLFPGKTQYSEDPAPEGLTIHRWINAANPLNWPVAARRIRQLQPDLVITRYWLPFMGPSLGTVTRLLPKSVEKVALCDNVIPHEARPGDRLFTRYFLAAFDRFITMSRQVREEIGEFSSKPVQYLPHPINDNLGERVERSEARRRLGLRAEGRYLLFFGLIRKYKGLDILLRALAAPGLRKLGVELIVAGEFYDDPAEYHDLIEELGLTAAVHLFDHYIPTAELGNYFGAADLVAQTYRTASQSGITQMAYHFDAPMLVTDVGGLAEIVPDGVVGYVAQPEPEDVAAKIERFYREDRREEFTAGVRQEKVKYSWDEFARRGFD